MTSQELVQRQREMVAFADDPQLQVELAEILPPTISVPVFIRGLKNAALANPSILKADKASLYRALLRAGMDGLIPDGREAAINVYNTQGVPTAQYLPMIGGVRKILAEYGWTLRAGVICANDVFEDHADEGYVVHRRPRPGVDRGPVEGAYAMAEHRDGRKVAEVYDLEQIKRARAKAKTQKIWDEWFEQMCEKTVAHRCAKKVPLDPKDRERLERVFAATEHLNGDEAIAALYGERAQAQARPNSSLAPPVKSATPSGEPAPPSSPDPADLPEPDPDQVIEGEVVESDDIPFGEDDEQPFEGEEPTDAEGLPDAGQDPPPTFTAGAHKGKTVEEVFALGDEGVKYLKWALRAWKTGTIVPALAAFAEEHPEIKP